MTRTIAPRPLILAMLAMATAIVIAIAIAAVPGVFVPGSGVAQAQTLAPPSGIAAADGAATGEARLTWNSAAGASQYRVGWINMNDFARAQGEGEPWLERFAFVNIRSSLTAYTIRRLTPGEEYAFIVASVPAAGNPVWPQDWVYLKMAAAPQWPVCPTGTPTTTPGPTPTPAPTRTPTQTPAPGAQTELSNQELVRRIKPALAQVTATNSAGETSSGTGFVVRADGLLVTNRHLVEDAETVEVQMQNLDGQLFDYTGRTLGRGILADLALVQLPAGRYATLPLGDSDVVEGGSEVIAMGYALGSILGTYPTVTVGVISSKRNFRDLKYFQTDAAINPGNSGGPLVDRYGRVIGINTSGVESIGDRPVEGISFAIASNEIASRLATLAAGGPDRVTYRNTYRGHGYRVDIPRGWYLESEDGRCTQFRAYDDRFNGISLCAWTFGWTTYRSNDLERLRRTVWNTWTNLAERNSWPLIELVRAELTGTPGQEYYRLAWRAQSNPLRCVGDEVSLVALSSSYPQLPRGFELNVGVCSGQPARYFAERQAILDSFAP